MKTRRKARPDWRGVTIDSIRMFVRLKGTDFHEWWKYQGGSQENFIKRNRDELSRRIACMSYGHDPGPIENAMFGDDS